MADYSYLDNQFRYHHYDARGLCILLTDSTGNLIEQYDYDAFGQPYFYNGYGTVLPNGSAQGNRFLFTGREWMSELRGYDYRNRLYHPQLGRFLQPDPKHFLAGDYSLYRYCHNDPVNHVDPTGLGYEDHMFSNVETQQAITEAYGAMPVWAPVAGVAAIGLGGAAAVGGAEIGGTALAVRGAMLARAAVPTAAAANKLVPTVTDRKLANLVRDLYKGAQAVNRAGTGSTADAVRREVATGQATGGKFHSEKAAQYIRALGNWQRANPNAAHRDQMVAETLKRDLQNALRGR